MRKSKKIAEAVKKLASFSKNRELTSKISTKCAYCGVFADTVDHVIPVSFLYSTERKNNLPHHKRIGNIVIACNECNILASNKVFPTFEAKKFYILGKVEERYKHLIKSPDWSDKEIEELTGELKKTIKNNILAKDFIKMRVENLKNPYEHE